MLLSQSNQTTLSYPDSRRKGRNKDEANCMCIRNTKKYIENEGAGTCR